MPEPKGPTPKTRKRRLLRLGLTLAACYLGICILMVALENWLLYRRTTASEAWDPAPDPAIHDLELATPDGTRIHAWWLPCAGAKGAVLYCHGNAGNLSYRGTAVLGWRQQLDQSVLIFDYPGYGKSSGSPTEAGCYTAAEVAYDWLVQEANVPPERILLFGKSLGGGVATQLASERPHRALVLCKAFTSAPDVAQRLYPWLPCRWLMRNRFDNLAKIGNCPRPVFIAHGTADDLIPLAFGERLFDAAREPKSLLRLEGAGHNTPLGSDFFAGLRQFLAAAAPLN